MRKKIKKVFKKVIRKVINSSKNVIGPQSKALALLRKELEKYPESEEKYLILRKRIIKNWLSNHSKNGNVLVEQRKIKICYNHKHLCVLGRKKEGCECHRKFFGYDFCYYFSPSKQKNQVA